MIPRFVRICFFFFCFRGALLAVQVLLLSFFCLSDIPDFLYIIFHNSVDPRCRDSTRRWLGSRSSTSTILQREICRRFFEPIVWRSTRRQTSQVPPLFSFQNCANPHSPRSLGVIWLYSLPVETWDFSPFFFFLHLFLVHAAVARRNSN